MKKKLFLITIIIVFVLFSLIARVYLLEGVVFKEKATLNHEIIINPVIPVEATESLNNIKDRRVPHNSISFDNLQDGAKKIIRGNKLKNSYTNKIDNLTLKENKSVEKINKRTLEKEIIDNLQGIESKFIVDGNKVDLSITQGIIYDDIFNDFLTELETKAALNQEILDTSTNYYDSFLQASQNLESGSIQINDFQCGEATCIASFTANNYDVWKEFLANRSNENYPYYTFSDYPNQNGNGTIEHRVFFSINSSINSMYMPFPPDG